MCAVGFEPWDKRAHHAGGLPIEGVGEQVRLRGCTGVSTRVAQSGHTVLRLFSFNGHHPSLTSASVICIVVVYRIPMACVSYNKATSTCL